MSNQEKQQIVRFDWAMKHLLRDKANYDIVEGFLSALFEDNEIKVIDILESETNQKVENDKFNKVDVLVKDKTGRNIIIEIQNTKESDYLFRLLFGTSKNIVESIKLGEKYGKINKVISISILYFNLGIGKDYLYYGNTTFTGITTGEKIDKDNEKVKKLTPKGSKYNGIEIFPEYYLIEVNKYKNVVERAIDEWIFWFKNEKIKEGSKSKNIKKVQEKLDYLKMDDRTRREYERFLDRMASELDMIETAKEEGREEGKEEGIKEIAKTMLQTMSVEEVQKITKLSSELLKQL